jgi:hypothetical protein
VREPRRHHPIKIKTTAFQRLLIAIIMAISALSLASPVRSIAAGLTIIDRPLDLVSPGDTVIIGWAEPLRASLHYAVRSGGGDPLNYPFVISDLITDLPGQLSFVPGDQLSPGIHYCLLTGGTSRSDEFLLMIESAAAPVTISPRTPQGEAGIETVDPVFRWHDVPGVPYYHLLLSDQPFRIQENESGEPCVTGANIIWQAITAGTSLPYGTPDPSRTLPPAQIPPLVSGLRYNWLVLNNYGNHPALSSAVTAGPSGFEVAVNPPFPAPEPIEPTPGAVLTESPITFRWSQVSGANCYYLYLLEVHQEDGSSVALPVFSTATGRTEYQLPASTQLRAGDHVWKVLAGDDAGYGALSQESRFTYLTASGTLKVQTFHDGGTPEDPRDDDLLPRTEVMVERLTGQGDPWNLLTDENGYADAQLPLGTYRLTGSIAGYRPSADTVHLTQSGQTVSSILVLSPNPSAVYGSTVDARGDPLPWVQVMASATLEGRTYTVESDINGAFLLQLEPDVWTVSVLKDGYTSPDERTMTVLAGQQMDLDDPSAGGPFVLTPCRYLLSGQVTNPDGGAIWQAEVTLSNPTTQLSDQTDALGQYEFSLEPGTWTVSASKPGYAQPEAISATITDADATANLVLVPRASLVSGWVTDGQGGLPEVTVSAVPLSGAATSVTTDRSGGFTLSLLPGTYRIAAAGAGHVSRDPLYLTLGRGDTYQDVELFMAPADASVRGRATSDGFSGLDGVLITDGTVSTVTGLDGSYRLPLLAGSHRLQAAKRGFLSARSDPLSLSSGQDLSGIDLVLFDHAGTLEGQVLCDGQPVGGARVTIRRTDGIMEEVQSDGFGTFVCSLRPGDYLVLVEKPGLSCDETQGRAATVRAGQWTVLEPFHLTENLARVGGTATSQSQPLGGVQVQLQALWPDGPNYRTVTDPDGQFALQVAAGGEYALSASRTGYLAAGDTVGASLPGSVSQVQMEMEPCESRIEGLITASDGCPLYDALVTAGDSATVYRARSEQDGRFRLPIRAGRYQLRVTQPGYAGQSAAVTVPLGSVVADQDFALQPNTVTIIGEVVDASSGVPLCDVLVRATAADSSRGGSVRSDAAGQFSISGLAPGVYRIATGPTGYQPQELTQRILVGGQFARVDFRLDPHTAVIHGSVKEDDAVVPGATIVVTEAGRTVAQAISDAEGGFWLARLPEGTLVAAAFKSGHTSPDPDTVMLEAGDTAFVQIELSENLGRVTGRASAAGVGIGEAVVTARGQGGNFASNSTAPDGRFRLSRLAADTYVVEVTSDGYLAAPAETSVVINAGDSLFIPFELSRCGLSVSGRVVDEDDGALSGVTVRASSGQQICETATNATGNYLLDDLSPGGVYALSTVFYEEGYVNDAQALELGAQDLAGVNLVVQVTQGIIAGSVEVEGASVTVKGTANGVNRTVLSQPDGSYQADYLPAGNYLVTAQKLGWASFPDAREVVGLGARERRAAVNFSFTADTVAIRGRVVDQDLDPVPGAPVTAICPRLTRCDTTDDQGWYDIGRLYPDQTYRVGTLLPDEGYDNAQLVVAAGRDDILAPQLQVSAHTAAIAGQIVDHLGQAMGDVAVQLSPGTRILTSDAQGRFRFCGLEAGHYELAASTTGWRVPVRTVEAIKGQTVTADLSLQPVQGAIYGQVRQAGRPLSGVLVTLSSSGISPLADTTDFSGNYAFEDLDVSRSYDLMAKKRGHETCTYSGIFLQMGESRRLDLYPSAVPNTIAGTVSGAEGGAPVPGTLVRAVALSGATRIDTCDGLGNYCLFDLPAGPCAVTAVHDGLTGESRSLVMAPGQAEGIDFVLAGRGSIAGTVLYRGQGRPGALVAAVDRQTGDPFLATSRAGGPFGIPGLTPGDYDISVSIRGFETAESPGCLTILPGTEQNLDIQLEDGDFTLLGSVRDTHDRPVAGAVVIASADGQADSTTTDLCGNYALCLSPSSRCIVQTRAGSHHQAPAETVSVVRGQAAVVDFELFPRSNSVYGMVTDGPTGLAIDGAAVVLSDSAGGQQRDTTSAAGEYLFSAQPGRLALSAERSGYLAWGPREIVLTAGGFVPQDVVLNPQVTTASLGGTVTWGDQPLCDVHVTARSLDGEIGDTVRSQTDGGYLFAELPAGKDYLLEAAQVGFDDLCSGPITLLSGGQVYDLHFPRGRIDWTVLGQGGDPLASVAVHLSSADLDTTLYTNAEGACGTDQHLAPGTYQAGLAAGGDYLPVMPYEILLDMDENRSESVPLAIRHTPFPPDSVFAVGEQIPICAWVEDPRESTEVLLFYRRPDDTDFSMEPMTPDGKGSLARKGRPTDESLAGRSGSTAVPYGATIPGGEVSGRLEYFIEARHHDRLYSRRSCPWELDVAVKGMLQRASLCPSEKRLPLDLPYVFQLQAYDGQGYSLNHLLATENVSWALIKGPGDIDRDTEDPTLATFVSHAEGVAVLEATVSLDGITLRTQAQVTCQSSVLAELEIAGPTLPTIASGSQATFRYVAQDESGRAMSIWPRWEVQPEGAGSAVSSLNGDRLTFSAHDDFIGQVRIFLTDSVSGETVEYNAGGGAAECDRGASVYYPLAGGTTGTAIGDGHGFRLIIPDSALTPGTSTQITLRTPAVPDVKRYTSRHQIYGHIYELGPTSPRPFQRPMDLVLPVCDQARDLRSVIGRWDGQALEWVEVGGTSLAGEISAPVDHFSQFAVLSISEPLGWSDIQLLPNPFTPHDRYGLQLAFALSSDRARKPFVTIRVYNLTGRLVRTICENEPVPKGIYPPGESFLDSKGRDITVWDGRTDSGELARNGRYLIHFRADDSSGTVERLLSVVLIK